MKFTTLTLFPELFDNFLKTSIINRAIKNHLTEIEIANFRKFSQDKNYKVDDTPYGGGPGMVLRLQPIVDAIRFYKTSNSKIILFNPCGTVYNQAIANYFLRYEHLILVCGHYEGFDERINNYVDYNISIGDYVLTGGEIPAMVIIDSIVRLIPNVISQESKTKESFQSILLDYSSYTKPATYEDFSVPRVLLEGNHKKINAYRFNDSIKKTVKNRPDLYQRWKTLN